MPQRRREKKPVCPISTSERRIRIQNLLNLGYIEHQKDVPDSGIPAKTTIPAKDYYSLPEPIYVREEYECRDCGKKVVWTPEEKYQYYEVGGGNVYARRVRCDVCYERRT